MPKYILKTNGKLLKIEDNGEPIDDINPGVSSKEYGLKINNGRTRTLDYMNFSATPSVSEVNIKNIISEETDQVILAEGEFVETENYQRYLPFNSFADTGDDENATHAFANLESKTQLAEGFSPPRRIVFDVLEEAFQIWVSTILISIIFETLYAQWKEDVRSKTDLTFGSHRQYASINILNNFIELLHKEANWPKTKSGAVSALATGLLVDFTNTDIVKAIKDLDTNTVTGTAIGFPGSIITLFLNNIVDGLLNSQDVFNRVKLRLRRIALDSAYKRIVRDSRSTVEANFGFTDFVNTYYFKYIVERINIGEKLLSKHVLGDHPLGHNIDTRYLPNTALTRLAKSKKGPYSNTIGNPSTSPLSLHQLESNLNVGHEIQRAIALDGNAQIKDLGALATKFSISSSENKNRFSKEDVEALENKLEAEYVPFYFHDLRNNEIMAFHAFIESISDSFSPLFNETDGYGRVEPVKTYSKTTRNISVNFTLAAMNPDDHDYMWFCVNRLVAMCYPQWSKGSKVDGGFTQPFSQIPTASPVIRMRLGDLFKSNYSLKNLARLFGAGDEDFSVQLNPEFREQLGNLSITSGLLSQDIVPVEGQQNGLHKIALRGQGLFKPASSGADDIFARRASLGDARQFKSGFGLDLPFLASKGDTVLLLPGIYVEDTNGFFQAFGAAGIKATIPNQNTFGRSYFKNNEYLKCEVLDYSDSTSLLSFFGGPSDEGKTHKGYYELKVPGNKTILASHDSVMLSNIEDYYNQAEIVDGPELLEGFMKPNNEDNTKIFNPIVKAFESSRGRGLAGVITQLDYNYNDSTWETSRIGSKAPQFMRVQLTFSPIHDIPLGLDHKGFMRAPAYPVGKVNRTFFGEVYDGYRKKGLSSAIENYEQMQNNLNEKM